MRKMAKVLACVVVLPFAAIARDNLASDPVNLPELQLHEDLSMSRTEYHLETGKSYRLVIKSDGGESFSFRAPDFFQQVWINGVAVEGLTIKTTSLTELAFDDSGGAAEILFVPIRPGKFDFWVEGYENRGMAGDFLVE